MNYDKIFISENLLPDGFTYPSAFSRAVTLGLTNIEPWYFLNSEFGEKAITGLRARYESISIVPFARRQDNDDLACWIDGNTEVVIIHDFASPGTEIRDTYTDFWSWFRCAVEDMINFDD